MSDLPDFTTSGSLCSSSLPANNREYYTDGCPESAEDFLREAVCLLRENPEIVAWAVKSAYPATGHKLGSAPEIAIDVLSLIYEELPKIFCDVGSDPESLCMTASGDGTYVNAYIGGDRIGVCLGSQTDGMLSSTYWAYQLWKCDESGRALGLIYMATVLLHEHLHGIGDRHPASDSDACDYIRVAQNNFLWLALWRFPEAARSCAAQPEIFSESGYPSAELIDKLEETLWLPYCCDPLAADSGPRGGRVGVPEPFDLRIDELLGESVASLPVLA
ncbi:MAG: hypothetical protein FJ102_11565 [Deltaproteobacteria bacterium]|nr:hypothetical protein [Deltaproteobacteria bacterium]